MVLRACVKTSRDILNDTYSSNLKHQKKKCASFVALFGGTASPQIANRNPCNMEASSYRGRMAKANKGEQSSILIAFRCVSVLSPSLSTLSSTILPSLVLPPMFALLPLGFLVCLHITPAVALPLMLCVQSACACKDIGA